ncbi:MAG: glycosyltransferase family 1 protein [Candidatus Methanofastidiosia archaeon]
MRVGIITDAVEYGPSSIANYVINLVENLNRFSDIDLTLIHRKKGDHKIYQQNAEVILEKSMRHFNPFSNLLRSLNLIKNVNRRLGSFVDIVHVPSLAGATAPPWAFLGADIPTVATLHGVAPLVLPRIEYYDTNAVLRHVRVWSHVLRWKAIFGRRIDSIITVSQSEKLNICRVLSIPEEKVHVIYHGVSPDFKSVKEEIAEKTLRKYDIDLPFIFHVSAYQPKKNVTRLIKAFKTLPSGTMLVMGGNQKSPVRELIRDLGVGDRVVCTGFVEVPDLVALYNTAALFAFPSLHESFGMPIVEAMACGCPVLTSSVFAMPEVAGDAAVLVNPYSVNEIAAGMKQMLTDSSLRKDLKKKGFRRAEKFTWEKNAESHARVYEEIFHG